MKRRIVVASALVCALLVGCGTRDTPSTPASPEDAASGAQSGEMVSNATRAQDAGPALLPDPPLPSDNATAPQGQADGSVLAGPDAALATGSDAGAAALPPPEVTPEPTDDASFVFDQDVIRTYDLTVSPADLATIDADPAAEAEVPVMLKFEGESFGPYSLRYKGSVGAFRPPCTDGVLPRKTGKCSLKLDFDDVDSNARFHGLKKLNLHAMNADPSMLRDRLGYALFREMGIAAPRAMHARVLINGKLAGLFIAVEQIDGRFARARFGDGGKGNVYKEVWPIHDDQQVYLDALETNRSENPSVQRMLDFKGAVAQGSRAVERYLDRDYLMRYTAVDRVIINDDGVYHWWCEYGAQGHNQGISGNHNYYWYEDQGSDRLWLIPWDLDTSFDGSAENRIREPWTAAAPCVCSIDTQLTIDWPASCDRLTQYIISWLDDYEVKVDDFIAGPFAAERVNAKLDRWAAQIDAAVDEAGGMDGAPTHDTWLAAVAKLRMTIDDARRNRGYKYGP